MLSALVLYLHILIFPKMHCTFQCCTEDNISDRNHERIRRAQTKALGLLPLVYF